MPLCVQGLARCVVALSLLALSSGCSKNEGPAPKTPTAADAQTAAPPKLKLKPKPKPKVEADAAQPAADVAQPAAEVATAAPDVPVPQPEVVVAALDVVAPSPDVPVVAADVPKPAQPATDAAGKGETPEAVLRGMLKARTDAGLEDEAIFELPWEFVAKRIDPTVGACIGEHSSSLDDGKTTKFVKCRSVAQLQKDAMGLPATVGVLLTSVPESGEPSLCEGLVCKMGGGHSGHVVHFAYGPDEKLFIAGVFTGDGPLDEADAFRKPVKRTELRWKAAIAKRFAVPLSKKVAKRILGRGPGSDTLAGYDATGQRFGVCAWACESRNSNHEVICSLGAADGKRAAPVSFDTWLAAGLVSVPPKKSFAALEHTFTMKTSTNEDAFKGYWRLRVHKADIKATFLKSGSEAFSAPGASLHPTYDGRLVGVGAQYSGDHGCGLIEAKARGVREGLVRAYLSAGLVHHKRKRLAEAKAMYELGLALDPDHAVTRFNKGCALALEGDAEAAAAEIRFLLKADATRWKAKIAADKDFDSIRSAVPYTSAMKGP